jgi:hypothetical protein
MRTLSLVGDGHAGKQAPPLLPFKAAGIDAGRGAAPQAMRMSCSATIARPKVTSSERMGSAV